MTMFNTTTETTYWSDEDRRLRALELAIESHGEAPGKENDGCFVSRARVFEAYLRGQKQEDKRARPDPLHPSNYNPEGFEYMATTLDNLIKQDPTSNKWADWVPRQLHEIAWAARPAEDNSR